VRPIRVVYDADNKRAYVLLYALGAGTYAQVYAAHCYITDSRPTWSAADMFARASSASSAAATTTTAAAAAQQRAPAFLTARDLIEAAALDEGPLSPALKRSHSHSHSRSNSPADLSTSIETAALDTRPQWRCKSAHVAPWAAFSQPNCVVKLLRTNSPEHGRVPDDDLIDEVQREYYTVRLMIEMHGRKNVEPLISRPLDMVVERDTLKKQSPQQSPQQQPLTEDELAERDARQPPIVSASLVYKYDPRTCSLNQWMCNFFWNSFSASHATEYAMVALEVGARLLDALGLMHSTSLVHRDVKAANILVTPRQERPVPDVKLTDMGFSMSLRSDPLLKKFKLPADYLCDFEREFFVDPDADTRTSARYNTTYHVRDPATFRTVELRRARGGGSGESSVRVRDKLFSLEEARTAFCKFDIYAAAVVVQRLFDPSDYPRPPAQFAIRHTARMPPHTLVDILRDMTRKDYANRATAREYALQLRALAARLQTERELARAVTPPETRRTKR
jgi:serine/threonine protein kinase